MADWGSFADGFSSGFHTSVSAAKAWKENKRRGEFEKAVDDANKGYEDAKGKLETTRAPTSALAGGNNPPQATNSQAAVAGAPATQPSGLGKASGLGAANQTQMQQPDSVAVPIPIPSVGESLDGTSTLPPSALAKAQPNQPVTADSAPAKGMSDWQKQSALLDADWDRREKILAAQLKFYGRDPEQYARLEKERNLMKVGRMIARMDMDLQSDDPTVAMKTQDTLVGNWNASNPNEQLVRNKNGSFDMFDSQGNLIQKNFQPSKQQMTMELARLANAARFMATYNIGEYATNEANIDAPVLARNEDRRKTDKNRSDIWKNHEDVITARDKNSILSGYYGSKLSGGDGASQTFKYADGELDDGTPVRFVTDKKTGQRIGVSIDGDSFTVPLSDPEGKMRVSLQKQYPDHGINAAVNPRTNKLEYTIVDPKTHKFAFISSPDTWYENEGSSNSANVAALRFAGSGGQTQSSPEPIYNDPHLNRRAGRSGASSGGTHSSGAAFPEESRPSEPRQSALAGGRPTSSQPQEQGTREQVAPDQTPPAAAVPVEASSDATEKPSALHGKVPAEPTPPPVYPDISPEDEMTDLGYADGYVSREAAPNIRQEQAARAEQERLKAQKRENSADPMAKVVKETSPSPDWAIRDLVGSKIGLKRRHYGHASDEEELTGRAEKWEKLNRKLEEGTDVSLSEALASSRKSAIDKSKLPFSMPKTERPARETAQPPTKPAVQTTKMPKDATRGERNNNPGNLRKTKDKWEGASGDDGSFVKFKTSRDGICAMAKTLGTYSKRGYVSVERIIKRWATENENDTKKYIKNVARELGVQPNKALDLSDKKMMQKLVKAIIRQENGRVSYSDKEIMQAISGK